MALDAGVAQLASVDKLAVSARDTKVPEDQAVHVCWLRACPIDEGDQGSRVSFDLWLNKYNVHDY